MSVRLRRLAAYEPISRHITTLFGRTWKFLVQTQKVTMQTNANARKRKSACNILLWYIYKNTTKNKNKTKQMEHSGEWVSNPQRAAEAHLQTNKDDHCIIPAKKQHVHQPSLETSCGTSPIPLVSTHRPVCWIYLWGSWFGAGGSIMWPEPFGSFCPLPTLGRPPAHRIPQHTRPAMQTDCKPWPAGKQKT